eukprot:COSAG01_NODE_3257_length_6345_cov_4.979987_6_plen_306_part_00
MQAVAPPRCVCRTAGVRCTQPRAHSFSTWQARRCHRRRYYHLVHHPACRARRWYPRLWQTASWQVCLAAWRQRCDRSSTPSGRSTRRSPCSRSTLPSVGRSAPAGATWRGGLHWACGSSGRGSRRSGCACPRTCSKVWWWPSRPGMTVASTPQTSIACASSTNSANWPPHFERPRTRRGDATPRAFSVTTHVAPRANTYNSSSSGAPCVRIAKGRGYSARQSWRKCFSRFWTRQARGQWTRWSLKTSCTSISSRNRNRIVVQHRHHHHHQHQRSPSRFLIAQCLNTASRCLSTGLCLMSRPVTWQ